MKRILLSFAAILVTNAHAFCFEEAGQEFNVNPRLLKAIAEVESGMRPAAINRDHIERTKTIDIGLMQINSGNLPRLAKQGVTKQALLDNPCLNVKVGAQILAEKYKKEGTNWEAVGAYNASCTQLKGQDCANARNTYVMKVWRALNRQNPVEAAKEFAGHTPSGRVVAKPPSASRITSVEIAVISPENNIE